MSRLTALVIASCVLLILSGIAGIAVGGTSAAAGWWLVVVFAALLVWIVANLRRSDTRA